jgi:ABC-type uncharacterized transport system ATPase subunit
MTPRHPIRTVAIAAHRSPMPPRREDTRAMSVIAFDGLTKRFGDIVAVDDLTVELAPGRVVGLLGPNGAGKRRPCACCSGW